MERITYKKLRDMIDELNDARNINLKVFPNMYGYGISTPDEMKPNLFNGKANECAAFIQGMMCTYNG